MIDTVCRSSPDQIECFVGPGNEDVNRENRTFIQKWIEWAISEMVAPGENRTR